jgi:hypothetical protein
VTQFHALDMAQIINKLIIEKFMNKFCKIFAVPTSLLGLTILASTASASTFGLWFDGSLLSSSHPLPITCSVGGQASSCFSQFNSTAPSYGDSIGVKSGTNLLQWSGDTSGYGGVDLYGVSGTPLTLGQKISASSFPVVIASDQTALSVSCSNCSGGTSTNFNATFPTAGAALGVEYLSAPPAYATSGQMVALPVSANGSLSILCNWNNCFPPDNSAFTVGTSGVSAIGGVFNPSGLPLTTANTQSAVAINAYRNLEISPYDTSGTSVTDATHHAVQVEGVASGTVLPINGTVTANAGTGTFGVALNTTPSLANGNGTVPTQGGAILSTTNGGYQNILQGNAILSATNPLPIEQSDGTNILGTAAHPVQVSLANTAANATGILVTGTFWQTTQPVSISQTTPGTTNAVQVVAPATGGGWSTNVQTALKATAVTVKASAGKLGFYFCSNPDTTTDYLLGYNTTSPTVGTTTPIIDLGIPSGSAANLSSDIGFIFSADIVVLASTSDTTSTAPTNGLHCTFGYN